jgi:NOL1/NOP2/sun family putative RNA methylase
MLPEKFKERMKALMGQEAEQLFSAIEDGDAVRSFRVNLIKTTTEEFERSAPIISRKKLDFPPDSYTTDEQFPSAYASHHSGAIYMQDPSAMATVFALDWHEGMRVLDSCAAPGGKTTQIAQLVGESGVVLANEYESKRARILQGNVERMGCKNVVVTNLDTAVIAEKYSGEFDVVLCDAPCSGEGMFRKNSTAISEWSEDNVTMCAERQREILGNVAKCVVPQGFLLYSTCTFSLEENEKNVEWFLDTHPYFELVKVRENLEKYTSDGINFEGAKYDMKLTRRFYPHVSAGEGQFIALMKNNAQKPTEFDGVNESERRPKKSPKGKSARQARPSRAELDAIAMARAFLEENLVEMPHGELVLLGSLVYLKPDIALPNHSTVAAGVCVGEVRGNRIVPHHQLFSAYGDSFSLKIWLDGSSKKAADYIRGMEIPCEECMESSDGRKSGYASVIVDGCALGGAKISSGMAKNHYPKGLCSNLVAFDK